LASRPDIVAAAAPNASATAALRIAALSVRYGRISALDDIDITVRPGEVLGLLGANGAGKTTLLNTLSGFLKPESGRIELFGERIDGLPPHAVVRRGLLHVSQERDLFGHLSVIDNLKLGSLVRGKKNFKQNLERVFGYFPRLRERQDQAASTMSGGEQQMLAIGRALMAEPKVLLFDEPSAGLSPLFVKEIGAMMAALKETDVVMILVEQNMGLASQVVDRFHILRAGRMVAEGPVSDLKQSQDELAKTYYL
jgi:branched-chain amino acid transport system ATP-binding protein